MSERYSRLYTAPANLYTAGSPVVIAAGALLKDNQTGGVLAQLKFLNIQGKKIKALKVALEAFDIEGKPLEGVAEYQYLDFDAARDAEFGQKQAIPMPDAVTRSFRCRCTSVIFSDGTTWAAPADAVWEPMPKPVMPADYLGMDLAGQYIRDVGGAKMVPVVIGDLWRCTCGALNGSGEEKCHKCSKDKEHLFACLEKSGLEERKAAYDAEQAKLAEEARLREEKRRAEEAARAEERRIAAEKKRRKQKKTTIILLVLAILGAAAYFLVTELIIPTMEFNKGIDLLDQDEFLAAYEIMAPLGDFHDAKNLAAEYCYAYAVERFRHKDFTTANEHLEAIGDYKDSQYYLHYRHEYTCTTTPAVCEVAGKYVYTCRCGNAYMESIPALEHVWKKADCYNPKTCTLCGKTEGEVSHSRIRAATCQAPSTCVACSQEIAPIDPNAHLERGATCIGKYCVLCDKVLSEPDSKAHLVWGATCTQKGTCIYCGKKIGEPLGHTGKNACTRCTAYIASEVIEEDGCGTERSFFTPKVTGKYNITLKASAGYYSTSGLAKITVDAVGDEEATLYSGQSISLTVTLHANRRYEITTYWKSWYTVTIAGADSK